MAYPEGIDGYTHRTLGFVGVARIEVAARALEDLEQHRCLPCVQLVAYHLPGKIHVSQLQRLAVFDQGNVEFRSLRLGNCSKCALMRSLLESRRTLPSTT